jgi:hypothetical protein
VGADCEADVEGVVPAPEDDCAFASGGTDPQTKNVNKPAITTRCIFISIFSLGIGKHGN